MRSLRSSVHGTLDATFRDPAGQLLEVDGRILRVLTESGAADLLAFLESASSRSFRAAGRIVKTDIVDRGEASRTLARHGASGFVDGAHVALVVEHEMIRFPTYPSEWSATMLYEAAALTLDLATAMLPEGLGLKDATPHNVLFRGTQPVFVDVLSVERRDPRDATWRPYAQFVQTFLLPLLCHREFGIPVGQLLSTHPEGVTADEVHRYVKGWRRLKSPVFTLVTMPTWLRRIHPPAPPLRDPATARFVLGRLFKHLRRLLDRVAPRPHEGVWSRYAERAGDNAAFARYVEGKGRFLEKVMLARRPQHVLDIGSTSAATPATSAWWRRVTAQASSPWTVTPTLSRSCGAPRTRPASTSSPSPWTS
jgi:hypothetical protein